GAYLWYATTSVAAVDEPFGDLHAPARVDAPRMVVGDDGCFTGEVEYYAYGPTKAEAVRELAASEGYDLARCYAYSDSVTDIPMLESVGHPHAVNPDRSLRREAGTREWPILVFNRPVRLKQRLPALRMPPRPALVAAAAIGAAAATAGLVWYANRGGRSTARRGPFARV
ncbi:HAD family hydrolase, partial [Streptomyces sp. NPDC059398]|uniref:HAD family hydrolase n=1 Tax=Streptomyces sp. NPDC059398 TaxID=3346820 RepID=UPI0036791F29